MARYSGVVGFCSSEETPSGSGVWIDTVTERQYLGDLVKASHQLVSGDSVNDNVVVSNNISIVADQYAIDNFLDIRYLSYAGQYWTISTVEVQGVRLIFTLGSVYNGPKA